MAVKLETQRPGEWGDGGGGPSRNRKRKVGDREVGRADSAPPRGAGRTPVSLQRPEPHSGAWVAWTLTPAGGASVSRPVLGTGRG